MANFLGADEITFRSVELALLNYKMSLIDERFTFNRDCFDLEYLRRLNYFLFGDLNLDHDLGFRVLLPEEKSYLSSLLETIVDLLSRGDSSINEVLEHLESFWELQPFYIGNTRTMVAFLKVLCSAYNLPYGVNIYENIYSSLGILKKLLYEKKSQDNLTK